MNSVNCVRLAALCIALCGAISFSNVAPAFARGGGSNFMNSAGYQRALQESRERYRRSYYGQPYIKPPTVYPGRKWRHRGTRTRH